MNLKRIIIGCLVIGGLSATSYGMTFIYKYYSQTKQLSVKPKEETLPPSHKKVIVKIIKKHIHEIEDCYNQRLEEGIIKEGALQIGWFLDGSGTVNDLEEMRNELNDPDLYECSAEVISQWQFPKDLILKVHYTFHLRQKREPASKNYESAIEEL